MILTNLIDFSGQTGWVLLLLPFAILTVVVIGVVVGRDRTAELPAAAPPMPTPTHADRVEPPRVEPQPPKTAEAQADAGEDRPWHEPHHEPAGMAGREAELLAAENRFDDAAVARISLQLAREMMAAASPNEEVKSHLRRAIILATRLKDEETHAAARLELGDLLGDEGDMTSACEHWQIARQIYWDAHAKDQLDDVDRRMMANGCPTDWVLNDF